MSRGKHVQTWAALAKPGVAVATVTGILLVAAAAAVMTGRIGWDDGGDNLTDTAASTSESDVSAAALEDAERSCRAAYALAQDALGAAEESLDQWGLHIDAMNQLVAGEITLQKARDFWEQTRVAAAEKTEAFQDADRAYRESGDSCDPAGLDDSADTAALRECAAELQADNTVLATAMTAVTTWEHHIHDMNMLRAGKLSPAAATAAWQKSWKAGAADMKKYSEAVRAAKDGSCTFA